MRALAIAIGASLVVNAVAIVWLRPTVAAAAGIVAPDDDSDVSRDETAPNPDPEDELVVELLDEPGASSS
ncbi:MAG TPA: hypothetical protein VGO00_13405, partial [Kofleriaceae bacterium]|nr:hypothetical protein [Kofleriaceae bacterium]